MHMNMINKYYFINKFDTNIINKQDKQTVIIYRNYESKIIDKLLILKIKKYCKFRKIKFYLCNDIKLALKLDLDGAYIPSFNKSTQHLAFSLKKNFKIIGSAHNFKEIKIKEKQGCKEIFISPIFHNPKNKYFLEIVRFNNLNLSTNISTIALGGINEKNLKKLRSTKVIGFASISWIKKTGLKLIRPV